MDKSPPVPDFFNGEMPSGLWENLESQPSMSFDNPIEPKHVTDYARELFIDLNIELTTINDIGQFTELKNIVDNKYHIPVPSGVDYVPIVLDFIDKFDQSLTNCAKKIHTEPQDEISE